MPEEIVAQVRLLPVATPGFFFGTEGRSKCYERSVGHESDDFGGLMM
jgi:hypothetical protein